MTERDKEAILRYINILGEEILRDDKIAKDLDEKIDMEGRNIPHRNMDKLLNLMGQRIKIAKAMIKNHDNIHKMIDYVKEKGYEVKWKEYTAIDLVKNENISDTIPFEKSKDERKNNNLCDTNPFGDSRFGG